MSIPRVALMVAFGLISSSGPAREPVVNAAAPAPQSPATAPAGTKIVRIFVLPEGYRGKGRAAIQAWAVGKGIEPLDIIVDGRTPWMFVHETLVEHSSRDRHFEHTAVHVSVSRREQIRWVRVDKGEFCVVSIRKDKAQPQSADAPPNPFPKLQKEACGALIDSGPPEMPQVAQRYKVTFRIGADVVDPDIVCEP